MGAMNTRKIVPIAGLSPYQNRWTIKARVTLKSPIRLVCLCILSIYKLKYSERGQIRKEKVDFLVSTLWMNPVKSEQQLSPKNATVFTT